MNELCCIGLNLERKSPLTLAGNALRRELNRMLNNSVYMVFVKNESVNAMDYCFCNCEFLIYEVMRHVGKTSVSVGGFFVDASRQRGASSVILFTYLTGNQNAEKKLLFLVPRADMYASGKSNEILNRV